MPDPLTPEERAAIAAFPKSKVYHALRGESGVQGPEYRYTGKTAESGAALVATNPNWAKEARSRAANAAKARWAKKRKSA